MSMLLSLFSRSFANQLFILLYPVIRLYSSIMSAEAGCFKSLPEISRTIKILLKILNKSVIRVSVR